MFGQSLAMADNVVVVPPGCKLPAAGFLGRLHVLVVDDDTTYLEELKLVLLLSGYSVTSKTTAEEALQELDRNPEDYFDIVMTDVHMPGMDGFNLLRGVNGRLPVIMFSEDEDVRTVMRAVLDGACDYMVKPMTSDVIRRIWMHVLRWRLGGLRPQASSLPIDRLAVTVAPPHLPTWSRRDGSQDAKLAYQPPLVRKENMRGDVREAAATVVVVAGSSRGDSQQTAAKAAPKKRGAVEVSDEGSNNFEPTQERKKARARFIWTRESHSAFLRAYNQLKDEAGPKRIKQLMELEGIFVTKAQVSSHLQKFRGWLETTNNNQVEGRSPYVLLSNYNNNHDISHCHLKRNSSLTEGPLAGMFSGRLVNSIATSNGRPTTSQSNYEGVGRKEIDNFISNHQTFQGTAIGHRSVIRHASLRSEVTSVGHDGSTQASTSALRQPTQTSQNCAANLGAINDPKPMIQEMSVPQIAPAPLGYGNDVSDWTELGRLDDLQDNDVLMNNLFDGDQLPQDVVTTLDETQEMPAFHINHDFRSVQSEVLNNDFPNYEINNGMNGASGGDLTGGMQNDPALQGDEHDILNYLE